MRISYVRNFADLAVAPAVQAPLWRLTGINRRSKPISTANLPIGSELNHQPTYSVTVNLPTRVGWGSRLSPLVFLRVLQRTPLVSAASLDFDKSELPRRLELRVRGVKSPLLQRAVTLYHLLSHSYFLSLRLYFCAYSSTLGMLHQTSTRSHQYAIVSNQSYYSLSLYLDLLLLLQRL